MKGRSPFIFNPQQRHVRCEEQPVGCFLYHFTAVKRS